MHNNNKFPTKIISAGLAVLGALSHSVSMSLAKQLDPTIPTTLVVFIRSCFGLLFFLPILINQRQSIVRTKNLPLHVIRVVLVVSAMLCTYYTYRTLPIAFATSIGMTSPIFITILSAILLQESISYTKWCLIFFGYVGVLFVIRPTSFILDGGIGTALLANLLAALCIIIIKILSKYDSIITIMIYSNIGIAIVAFVFNINGWQALGLRDVILLSLTGLLGIITQTCSITALKYSSPSFVAPFEYTRIFFASLIGVLIFQETLNIYMIIGTLIIIFSTYMITYLKA
jgi:drug/metabolite transporter (DMT)-like permease